MFFSKVLVFTFMLSALCARISYASVCCPNGEYENNGDCVKLTDGFFLSQCNTLPPEYVQLEYIQNSGQQYIDSEPVVNSDDSYAIEYVITPSKDSSGWTGANAYLQLNITPDGYSTYQKADKFIPTYTPTGEQDIVKITYSNSTETLYINDTKIESHDWSEFEWQNVKILIFALGQPENMSHGNAPISAKLYSCKIWQDSTLLRYFLPVLRTTDRTVGMYDILNMKFYKNVGTNQFTAASTEYDIDRNFCCKTQSVCAIGEYCINGERIQCLNAPENASYNTSGWTNANCPWECNIGYAKAITNTCNSLCGAGITTLRTSTGIIVPLFAKKNTTPSINIKHNDTICYADLVEGQTTNAIHVQYNGHTYHTTN